jgi:hypothetical protein
VKIKKLKRIILHPASYSVALACDLVCFLVFALSGLNSHHEALSVVNLSRAAGTFAAAWVVVAYALAPLLAPAEAILNSAFGPLVAWVVAWASGFGLRMLLFHRSFEPAFAAVSFLVLGAMLVVWRLVLGRLVQSAEGGA